MPNPRKPRALKLVEGTLQPCRDQPEPDFPVVEGVPKPPSWLDGRCAIGEWKRLAPLLTASRVLTADNLTLLAILCNTFADYRKRLKNGDEIPAALLNQIRVGYSDFGMSPVSRSKARPVGDGRAKNPFATLGG